MDGSLEIQSPVRIKAHFCGRKTVCPMNNLFRSVADGDFWQTGLQDEQLNSEPAIVNLMELFNHSSVAITKRYLGLRQEEILQIYDCLTF